MSAKYSLAAYLAAIVLAGSSCVWTESHAAIRAEPANVCLYPGGTQQLLVTGLGARELDRTRFASYGSSAPDVATVSPRGLVRARQRGTAVVTVTDGRHVQQLHLTVAPAETEPAVRFVTDVVPMLTKLGCNGGGCHGKATGQNGFKLSLLGFEPESDYGALVKESRGRRLFPNAPDRSLLLLKATARVPHGGGRRLDPGSDDYHLLQKWVTTGAMPPVHDEPVLEQIELTPAKRVVPPDSTQQLVVSARFSDGTVRDVTRQAIYHLNEPDLAEIDDHGLIQTTNRSGLFSVMVRFGGEISTFHAVVPQVSAARRKSVDVRLEALAEEVGGSTLNAHLLKLWRQLGVAPSPPTDDETFIRRATIDICGTLPTRDEIQQFVADATEDKRMVLVDSLLERPEYASYFALKWADILQNRGSGYSTSKQREGTALFAGWIRDSIAFNKPYDRFVAEILTASGNQDESPPAVWYRSVRTLPNYVESVAQAFMGVRIQCAQCHHHPFERWSQADYYGLAAVFARTGRKGGFADAEVPTGQVIYLNDQAKVHHPRTGQLIRPRALGGPEFKLGPYDDPRRALAQWLTHRDNPYFARTMVNRMWAHFLGRGIIHPIDDARSTNPASNPQLLHALTQKFVASGYDVKQLIRSICNCHAYRIESVPDELNENDTQTFARFYPRRLSGEVLLDGISQVLEVATEFPAAGGKFPMGTRAIDLPDENVPAHFLDVFGRPPRTSACECERIDAPSLAQALELVNSAEIQRKLTAEDGYVSGLVSNEQTNAANVTDVFYRVFARPPAGEELRAAVDFIESEEDRADAYQSLVWSLLASNEFLFNH